MSRLNCQSESRRHFLRGMIAGSALFGQNVAGQNGSGTTLQPSPTTTPGMTLAKEWNDAYLLAVSPAGDNLCLYFTKQPLTTFTQRPERWTYGAEPPEKETFAVFEIGAWKTTYSTHLRARPAHSSFFSDGKSIYVETNSFAPRFRNGQRTLIDLQSGKKIDETDYSRAPGEGYVRYCALNKRMLLGVGIEQNPSRAVFLARAALPTYQELARVPYPVEPMVRDEEAKRTWGDRTIVSADRSAIVYTVGRTIVLRRSEDLGIVWTRQIEPSMFAFGYLAISANGSRAAVAILDLVNVDSQQARTHLAVYDGVSAEPLATLSVDQWDRFAISPNGTLVARGSKRRKGRDVELSVEIYNLISGQLLASGLHDTVPPGTHQDLTAIVDGIEFTSDGRYLVSSGNNRVKVWQL